MIRFAKRLIGFAACIVVALVLVRFGPTLWVRIFGGGNTQWISERFSETLREKNELVVYEVEITGQETVSQDAWLLGTVQKVEMPYTFRMSFTVDLSRAQVVANGNTIEVHVPSPQPGYQKLIVDESKVKKYDWFYRLTTERYAAIKQEVEDRLFDEYSQNETYRQNAWNTAVHNLESMFGSVAEQSRLGNTCQLKIVQDDNAGQPEVTPQP